MQKNAENIIDCCRYLWVSISSGHITCYPTCYMTQTLTLRGSLSLDLSRLVRDEPFPVASQLLVLVGNSYSARSDS